MYMTNNYDKMEDYIKSEFDVFQKVKYNSSKSQDRRMQTISLTIYNYSKYMAEQNNVNLKECLKTNTEIENMEINLIPIFEYISSNNIELLDFSNININDIDITKKTDLERFILTHIYYITQK